MDWILIPDGSFTFFGHVIDLPAFEISRSEVTVAQYRLCVQSGYCNNYTHPYNQSDVENNYVHQRENYPMNYLSWIESRRFAQWVGGDLPSYSQWLYAASDSGQRSDFPPTSDRQCFSVDNGCATASREVCSTPTSDSFHYNTVHHHTLPLIG